MQRFRYLFAILGLLACLATGLYAHPIENPLLAMAAIAFAAVATAFASRYYWKYVAEPNLKKAESSPAIRSGPFYWALRLAAMLFIIGFAGFLFVSRHQADIPEYMTYRMVAGALAGAGLTLMVVIIAVFKTVNRS